MKFDLKVLKLLNNSKKRRRDGVDNWEILKPLTSKSAAKDAQFAMHAIFCV
jgi:hypothetical protein